MCHLMRLIDLTALRRKSVADTGSRKTMFFIVRNDATVSILRFKIKT